MSEIARRVLLLVNECALCNCNRLHTFDSINAASRVPVFAGILRTVASGTAHHWTATLWHDFGDALALLVCVATLSLLVFISGIIGHCENANYHAATTAARPVSIHWRPCRDSLLGLVSGGINL